jgi:branched-subunit amino acid transport protein
MNLEFVLVMAAAGLVTWVLKTAFIESSGYLRLPHWFSTALDYVPPAVLCALVIPGIFKGDVGLVRELGAVGFDPRIPAALAAVAVYLTSQRTIPTLVVGMSVLYGAYWLQI